MLLYFATQGVFFLRSIGSIRLETLIESDGHKMLFPFRKGVADHGCIEFDANPLSRPMEDSLGAFLAVIILALIGREARGIDFIKESDEEMAAEAAEARSAVG